MERHAVLFLMYNTTDSQLELTKQALASILEQDIGMLDVYVCNNGSTAPTKAWLDSLNPDQPNGSWLYIRHSTYNVSPVKMANDYCATLFQKYDKVIGVPNDVILPANTYSELAKVPRGFVSATPVEDVSQLVTIPKVERAKAISTNTPLCVCMTRRWAYQAIVSAFGEFFDEQLFNYCSDCDLALKMAACGIVGVQMDLSFWHYRSGTLRLANQQDRRNMELQADAARAYFQKKWGFKVTDAAYQQTAANIDFRGESKIWTEKPDGLTEFIESKIGKTSV